MNPTYEQMQQCRRAADLTFKSMGDDGKQDYYEVGIVAMAAIAYGWTPAEFDAAVRILTNDPAESN